MCVGGVGKCVHVCVWGGAGECGGCTREVLGIQVRMPQMEVCHRIKNKFAPRITEHLANIGVPMCKRVPIPPS